MQCQFSMEGTTYKFGKVIELSHFPFWHAQPYLVAVAESGFLNITCEGFLLFFFVEARTVRIKPSSQ